MSFILDSGSDARFNIFMSMASMSSFGQCWLAGCSCLSLDFVLSIQLNPWICLLNPKLAAVAEKQNKNLQRWTSTAGSLGPSKADSKVDSKADFKGSLEGNTHWMVWLVSLTIYSGWVPYTAEPTTASRICKKLSSHCEVGQLHILDPWKVVLGVLQMNPISTQDMMVRLGVLMGSFPTWAVPPSCRQQTNL